MKHPRTKAPVFVRVCAGLIGGTLLWFCFKAARHADKLIIDSELIGQYLLGVVALAGGLCGGTVFAILCLTGDTPSWMHPKTTGDGREQDVGAYP